MLTASRRILRNVHWSFRLQWHVSMNHPLWPQYSVCALSTTSRLFLHNSICQRLAQYYPTFGLCSDSFGRLKRRFCFNLGFIVISPHNALELLRLVGFNCCDNLLFEHWPTHRDIVLVMKSEKINRHSTLLYITIGQHRKNVKIWFYYSI